MPRPVIPLLSVCLLLIILLANAFAPPSHDEADPQRPNVILFLVDDMGWQDTSVPFHTKRTPFNDHFRTPNMEQIASGGRVFTNAYSASPVCAPTRASIMTGRNPARTHITDWTLYPDLERQQRTRPDLPVKSPEWRVEGLQPADTTLPILLQSAGYRTIHVGKAHFGALGTPGADPTTLGFEVNISGHAAGAPGSYYGEEKYGNRDHDSVWGVPDLEKYHESDVFLTAAHTAEANKAIADAVRDGVPFFLDMSHYAVHTPIMADSQYVSNYPDSDSIEAAYATLVEGVDASLGAILDKLDQLNVAEETLILFMSDNGGLSAHSRGTTPMGTGPNTHNLPLRSGKGSAYEGGIRVAMITAWARVDSSHPMQRRIRIRSGSRTDVPIISDDFFPSILDVAGVPIPDEYVLDGLSFVPVLHSDQGLESDRLLVWHYPHLWGPRGPGLTPFTALRIGDWKLIYFYDTEHYELYNLSDDLSETINLAYENPKVTIHLSEQLREWMKEVGAQTPMSRITNEAVPYPPVFEANVVSS